MTGREVRMSFMAHWTTYNPSVMFVTGRRTRRWLHLRDPQPEESPQGWLAPLGEEEENSTQVMNSDGRMKEENIPSPLPPPFSPSLPHSPPNTIGLLCMSGLLTYHLHQQTSDTAIMNLVVMWTNTMISFWNMSKASAPIHITATSVK